MSKDVARRMQTVKRHAEPQPPGEEERDYVRSFPVRMMVRRRERAWLTAVAEAWGTAPATVAWTYMHAGYAETERLAADVAPCHGGLVAAVVAARRLRLKLTGLEALAEGPALKAVRSLLADHPEQIPTAELRATLESAGLSV